MSEPNAPNAPNAIEKLFPKLYASIESAPQSIADSAAPDSAPFAKLPRRAGAEPGSADALRFVPCAFCGRDTAQPWNPDQFQVAACAVCLRHLCAQSLQVLDAVAHAAFVSASARLMIVEQDTRQRVAALNATVAAKQQALEALAANGERLSKIGFEALDRCDRMIALCARECRAKLAYRRWALATVPVIAALAAALIAVFCSL